MTGMAEGSGYRERNSTADRALSILQLYSDERPELTALDVAEHLGVARSTAYRYLQTLVQSDFLAETGRGGFRLGLRILELSRIARTGYDLTALALPRMRDLAERYRQTVLLTKQMGAAVICLEREEAYGQYVRLSYERGTVLDFNAGASALVLFAWLPEATVRELLATTQVRKFTPKTLVEPDEIIERLAQIRQQGFALTDGEVDPNAVGIAAPVFGRDGQVLAAVSMVFIRPLVALTEIDDLVASVRSTAEVITQDAAAVGR
ncbi:IclR family transcriptional regulator [Kribbella qitaiheensis]|uniref:IclR family transcriptional regulator n=1 Tax=Kribbella qitaiheensis TaxID=1544730 RepID=A0A7G6X537_9ACTN|nr:IclR family transcriptional regulator [Kribbella qitaiheensis]QNE21352.1 IclR family transcriptional regulator [Kribbella qitaiheensis]